MPQQQHHTLPAIDEQLQSVIQQGWEQEVLPQLPANYEEQAHRLGAFVRQGQIKRPADLLRALLAYVLCAPSFRQLGSWALLIGLANLSNVAGRKRLRQSRAWLLWLLCELLALTSPPAPSLTTAMPHILLIDATRLKEPGGCGDDWRVHLGYDLLAGRLVDVRVADRHTAEAFELFVIAPGDVLVADRGYSRRSQWAYALLRGADVVVRLAVHQLPLLDEQGASLDVVAWLQGMQSDLQSRWVAFEHEGQRFAGRLIACALPAEAAERARAKARKKASKQQRELKAETLFLAGWLLVFTSLPTQRWSDSQVLALYQARWQIELVIKRMKQVLQLAQLRGQTSLTNEATILAVLVCWALQQQEAASARTLLQQGAAALQSLTTPPTATVEPLSAPTAPTPPAAPVSSWLLTSLCVQTLRIVVQGYWTSARLLACLPYLHRFVCGSPRQRVHQETTICSLLTSQSQQMSADPARVFSYSSA
jgi:Transposase DDE domain